jgi:hypothetical protein
MNTKPAILILSDSSAAAREIREPVLWGIEEEGVPYEIRKAWNESATEMAKQAANGSGLNVGIAISEAGEIVLHHRDLAGGAPLFAFSAESLQSRDLRRLGTNAARLVKRQPLVLTDRDDRKGLTNPGRSTPYALEGLVSRILDELLREHASHRD